MSIIASLTIASSVFFCAQTADAFPDTPVNHWAYEGLSYMKSQGLLVGYPDGLGYGPHRLGRYEAAVCFHAGATNLKSVERESEKSAERIPLEAPDSEGARSDLIQVRLVSSELFKRTVNYMARAAKDFAPELKGLGASTQDILGPVAEYHAKFDHFKVPEPGSALRQFPDVPASHWAAKDVLEMRRLGLLHGYPDGTLKG